MGHYDDGGSNNIHLTADTFRSKSKMRNKALKYSLNYTHFLKLTFSAAAVNKLFWQMYDCGYIQDMVCASKCASKLCGKSELH